MCLVLEDNLNDVGESCKKGREATWRGGVLSMYYILKK